MSKTPFNVDQAAFLSRHDLVFLSPPDEGWEGLPIGNGRMGGPLWIDERGLCFQLNHNDTREEPEVRSNDKSILFPGEQNKGPKKYYEAIIGKERNY